MLEIHNLHADTQGTKILKGVDLVVNPGEIHAIMGPNGSGKSTLAYVLAGKPVYTVTAGDIIFNGQNIVNTLPEQRAQAGLFLSFQHPVEIPGVRLDQFLRAGFNSIRKNKNLEELDVLKFDRILKKHIATAALNPALIKRNINEGFSGGERKRNEILQMAVLEPTLAILDEPDSGLDIDAVKTVATGINSLRNEKRSIILITHYQRILNYVIPDFVHIFMDGKIIKSGGKELATQIETEGYDRYETNTETA